MKRLVFLMILIGFLAAKAQVAMLDRVYDLIQKKDIAKAEEGILIAEKHATTVNDARTYYLKAFIYKQRLSDTTSGQREEYRSKAWASIQRCRDLDFEKTYERPAQQLEDYFRATTFNDASSKFNKGNYSEAIVEFREFIKRSILHDKSWQDAQFFMATAFYNLQNLDSAATYYRGLKETNYNEPSVFLDLADIYRRKNKDENALEVIREGLARFPSFYEIQITHLNLLMLTKHYAELQQQLEKFLAANPKSIEALLMSATTYLRNATEDNRAKAVEKSISAYRTVLEMDPGQYDANYNLGVLYYNEAVDIVNKNDFDTDISQLTLILEKSTRLFEQALPLLLKIYDSRREDLKILHALRAIYYNLNMKEKLVETEVLINGLEKK